MYGAITKRYTVLFHFIIINLFITLHPGFEGRMLDWYIHAFTGIIVLINSMALFISSLVLVCFSQ